VRESDVFRKVAIAVPAHNEAEHIGACVNALLSQACNGAPINRLSVHILANNCADETAAIVRTRFPRHPTVHLREIALPPPVAHAGWARRLAMEAATESLRLPTDLILSTDADTIVTPDWLTRMLDHFDRGFDAVAGRPIMRSAELSGLAAEQRARLQAVGKYQALVAYLRRRRTGDDAAHHNCESGASIALTLASYRAIGGCPAVPLGEDRALFAAVRRAGGRVCHAGDVKVYTSGRLVGRAPGGTADTIRRWCHQAGDEIIQDIWPLNVELGNAAKTTARPLTFDELPVEIARAKRLVRQLQSSGQLQRSA
jgi:cellulose synthase/poly-beta-1,6-N-acetylglucosamine synthase-like glycosyltransferase